MPTPSRGRKKGQVQGDSPSFSTMKTEGIKAKAILMRSPLYIPYDLYKKPALVTDKLREDFPDDFARFGRTSMKQAIGRLLATVEVATHYDNHEPKQGSEVLNEGVASAPVMRSSNQGSVSEIVERSDSGGVPSAASLVMDGFPGIQYLVVDPDTQYQKFLIVVLQAFSGTDPSHPPSYSPVLTDDGNTLKIDVPCSPVLVNPTLLVHPNCAWMKDGGTAYDTDRSTRLSGLGPAIADLQGYCNENVPSVTWSLPLQAKCSDIIGNFSITNFPAKASNNLKFFPVLVEFKLKCQDQSVASTSKIKVSVWDSDDMNGNDNCKKVRLDDKSFI